MKNIRHTIIIDLEEKYNGDFKTDKEILVLALAYPMQYYTPTSIQACIINPHHVELITNDEQLTYKIMDQWMPERSDKYPFTINCPVREWIIESDMNERKNSFITDVQITSIDIYKHLQGKTKTVGDYYIFTQDPGNFDNIGYAKHKFDGGFLTDDDFEKFVTRLLSMNIKRIGDYNMINMKEG